MFQLLIIAVIGCAIVDVNCQNIATLPNSVVNSLLQQLSSSASRVLDSQTYYIKKTDLKKYKTQNKVNSKIPNNDSSSSRFTQNVQWLKKADFIDSQSSKPDVTPPDVTQSWLKETFLNQTTCKAEDYTLRDNKTSSPTGEATNVFEYHQPTGHDKRSLEFPLLVMFCSKTSSTYNSALSVFHEVNERLNKTSYLINVEEEYKLADELDISHIVEIHLFLDAKQSVAHKGELTVDEVTSWTERIMKFTPSKFHTATEMIAYIESHLAVVILVVDSSGVADFKGLIKAFVNLGRRFIDGSAPTIVTSSDGLISSDFAFIVVTVESFNTYDGNMIATFFGHDTKQPVGVYLMQHFDEKPTAYSLPIDKDYKMDDLFVLISRYNNLPLISHLTESSVETLFGDERPVLLLIKHPRHLNNTADATHDTTQTPDLVDGLSEDNEMFQDLSLAFESAAKAIQHDAIFLVSGTTLPIERRLLSFLGILGFERDPNIDNSLNASDFHSDAINHTTYTSHNNSAEKTLHTDTQPSTPLSSTSCVGDVVWVLSDFTDTVSVQKYRLPYLRSKNDIGQCRTITANTIIKFYDEATLSESAVPTIRSEKIPDKQTGPVYNLVASTFWDVINTPGKNFFVLVYASWCGHSRKVDLEFREAASRAVAEDIDVVFARIDAAWNDVPPLSGEEYPYLVFISNLALTDFIIYDGGTTNREMLEFVQLLTAATGDTNDDTTGTAN